jgi:hypothetical protein
MIISHKILSYVIVCCFIILILVKMDHFNFSYVKKKIDLCPYKITKFKIMILIVHFFEEVTPATLLIMLIAHF